ncbi:hypothetical protein GGI02_000163 [Coemansia sp. RSA 2322]|nr:hypothetical protein GGI02_000163 [Coemansia sp. RSA 2322]
MSLPHHAAHTSDAANIPRRSKSGIEIHDLSDDEISSEVVVPVDILQAIPASAYSENGSNAQNTLVSAEHEGGNTFFDPELDPNAAIIAIESE